MEKLFHIQRTRGGEHFFDEIARAILAGDNVIVVLPERERVPEIAEAIKRRVRKKSGPPVDILDSSKKASNLLSFMNSQKIFQRQREKKLAFSEFFGSSEIDSHKVLCIFDPEAAIAAATAAPDGSKESPLFADMARDLTEAATASRVKNKLHQNPRGYRFLAIVSPHFPTCPNVEGLTTVNWWGRTTSIDQEIMFEEAVADLEPMEDVLYWWLKAVCLAVGGDDPFLIDRIVKESPKRLEQIKDILTSHPIHPYFSRNCPVGPGEERRQEGQDFEYEGRLLYRGVTHIPGDPPMTHYHRNLWEKGLLSPNRLCMYHPVVLTGDLDLLEKFIVSGQLTIFFSLIDQVLGTIIHIVEEMLGKGAFEHYIREEIMNSRDKAHLGKEEREKEVLKLLQKTLTEIGPMAYSLKFLINPADSHKSFIVKELTTLAYAWVNLRNIAAHNEMCSYENLEKAMSLYETTRRSFLERGPGAYSQAPRNYSHARA
jgi:hypothetical protein